MEICDICGKEFKNTQGLMGHKSIVHPVTGSSGKHSAVSTQHSAVASQHSAPVEADPELAALQHQVKVAMYESELAKFKAITEKWSERLDKIEKELPIMRELIIGTVDTALGNAMAYSAGKKHVKELGEIIFNYVDNFAENIEKEIRKRFEK